MKKIILLALVLLNAFCAFSQSAERSGFIDGFDKSKYKEMTLKEFCDVCFKSDSDIFAEVKCHFQRIDREYTESGIKEFHCYGDGISDVFASKLIPSDIPPFTAIELYIRRASVNAGSWYSVDGWRVVDEARFVGQKYIATDALKIRETPSLSAKQIGRLFKGDRATVIEVGEDVTIDGIESAWVKVRTKDGVEGWCFAGYLTDGKEYREKPWKSAEKADSAFADEENPFDVSFPVFSDADVFIKSQKIVCTEKLVSIDYVISGKEKENVSAVIDCKVLGFQRLCNDIVIPLDFCIKSKGKEIPFEVYRNGNLVDKSSYYSGLKEYGGEYKYEDKIEIKFAFELKGEETITVSYENLQSYHMFGSLYIIQMAKNPDGTPIDYTFIYQGLADSKLYPSKMCLSVNDGRGYTKQDYTLQFSRDTKGEFSWKTELKQFSALDGECFWIEFKYFGVLEEFDLVFIPCWDENPTIIAYTDESSCINLSKEIIPEALLFYMTKSQLALLRNAFYAIYGYKFKNPKYAEYFGQESNELWYKINPNFTEKDFNEIEKANINLIKKYEEQ